MYSRYTDFVAIFVVTFLLMILIVNTLINLNKYLEANTSNTKLIQANELEIARLKLALAQYQQ